MSDEESEKFVRETWCTRIINKIFCRSRTAKEPLEAQPVPVCQLLRYATSSDKLLLSIGMLLAMFIGAIHPFPVIVEGVIANIYLKDKNHKDNKSLLDRSLFWCGVALIGGIVTVICAFIQSYLLSRVCTNIVRTIRKEFVKAVLHQEAEWFDGTQAGAITAKLNDNVERIRDGLSDKMAFIFRGCNMFTSATIFAFIVNWRVTVASIAIGPVGAIAMSLLTKFSAKPIREQMKAVSEATAVAEEAIMNVKTVAACNGQNHMIKKYESILDKSKKIGIRTHIINGIMDGFLLFQVYSFSTAGLIFGIISYFNGHITEPGTVIMASNAVVWGAFTLSSLGPQVMSLLKARVAAAVIYNIIDRKQSDVSSLREGIELEECEGKIEFTDVHFRYPTRDTPILNGCSWAAEAGETVAFVGHSGCGKSTSIGLITRLYALTGGKITIDEIPIERINVKSLRKLIGIVSQEPCLFNGTIRENIVLDRTITDEIVENAARTANAHDFIEKFENGYDTLMGVGGVLLSGGQKQRIAIARAIVTNPKILILDEATSALDSESERVVQLALNRASKGRTTIMIAHRLSTLRDVQKIHVMEGGIITEIGNHTELCAKGGLYASLAKSQQLGIMEKPEGKHDNNTERNRIELSELELSSKSLSIRECSIPAMTRQLDHIEEKPPKIETKKESGSDPSSLWRIYFGTGKWTWQLWATAICIFLRGVDMPVFSYMSMLPFLALQATKDTYMHYVWILLIAYISFGLFLWIAVAAAGGFGGYSGETLVNKLRLMCLKKLLHQDAAYFDQPEKSNAQCVTTIALHTPPLLACYDVRFVMICNNVLAVFFCLILAFAVSWPIGIAIFFYILFSGLIFFFLTKSTNECMRTKDEEDKTPKFALEIFEHARTIQLLVAEDYFCERFEKYQEIADPWEKKLYTIQSITFALIQSFTFFCEGFFFAVGAYCVYKGNVTAAVAIVAVMAGNMSSFAVIMASPAYNSLMSASVSANGIFKMIGDEKLDEEEKQDKGTKPPIEGSLSVKNVEFAYPTRPNTLVARDLSLSASKGQSIALVGASGCGKSTIIQLLERFYEPLKGTINIDGSSIHSMSLNYLRQNIALVGQEPVLFTGSILENICLGCEEVPFEDVKRVAEMANAAHFIENLPLGYETDVGEKGKALSGGQKQRIAIARALIRNPKILLLDEATSALDTQSEGKVQLALDEASAGRTTIIIAHRLSTIKKCDRIFYIENGGVVEFGTHEELLVADGKYAKLVEAQTLGS